MQEAPASAIQTAQAVAPAAASDSSLFIPLTIGIVIAVVFILGALLLMKKRSLAKQTAGLLAKAARGDAKAQFEVFGMYKNKQDKFREAMQFLSQSAEQGYAEAQTELGLRCQTGDGVEKNSAQAVEWFRKAADQGLPNAQYNLALRLQAGEGIAKNASQAVAWFREAADQNHTDAQCELGLCYMNGDGIDADKEQAMAWLKKAADKGSKKAEEAWQGLKYLMGAKN
jgi:TPR repeat protein